LSTGNWKHLLEIQEDNRDKYDALMQEEKDVLIQEFKAEKDQQKILPRLTYRARQQEVTSVFANMSQMVCHRISIVTL
jgi:hypothetical protein